MTAPSALGVTSPTMHVVVLDGGFGGLEAVRRLARAHRAPIEVTLIDRRNHHTFQPLLYQVATAGLQPQDIGMSFRSILRRRGSVRVRLGDVVRIDPARHRVVLDDGSEVAYDRLVLAVGAIAEDFVVAGGGPTGVELAGALAELVDLVVRRDHPDLDVDRVRIVLAEPRDRLLSGFHPRSGRAALRGLVRRGVEVRLGTGIARAAPDHVELTDGQVLATHTLVWAAGVAASPLAATLGVELTRGRRLPVDEHLGVAGVEDVHAIGDVAGALGPDGSPLPQVAQVAIHQGRNVADVLAREAQGRRPPAPFRYRDLGSMATIGRNAAVVDLPGGFHLGGFVAWVAWLLLHVQRLVGFKTVPRSSAAGCGTTSPTITPPGSSWTSVRPRPSRRPPDRSAAAGPSHRRQPDAARGRSPTPLSDAAVVAVRRGRRGGLTWQSGPMARSIGGGDRYT